MDPIHSSSSASQCCLPAPDELPLDFAGDRNAQLAALFLMSAHQTRESGRTARFAEEAALQAAEQRQVDAMHEQADAIRQAGLSRGLSQICGGLLTMVTPFAKPEATAGLGATTTGLKGLGDIAGSYFDATAKHREADSVAARNDASASTRRLEDLSDIEADSRELERVALEFARNAQQTRAATEEAALYLRA